MLQSGDWFSLVLLKGSLAVAKSAGFDDSTTPPDAEEGTAETTARRLKPRNEESALLAVCSEWDWGDLAKKLQIVSGDSLRGTSISSGRHQTAEHLARHSSSLPHPMELTCFHIDSFQASRTEVQFKIGDDSVEVSPPPNLSVLCAADLPDTKIDFGLLSVVATGEAELTRDYLQQLYHQLQLGGILFVSVDNLEDKWVHEQLKGYEKRVKVRRQDSGMVYCIEKTRELKKLKDFACELAYRDCDELVRLVTRPGVFSHRQLDNGARQLLDAVDVYPEAKILDIGCGAGSVALGLAKRDPSAHVHAVDANARAIDSVQRGIALNGLTNVTTEVNWTGVYGEPNRYDMALANPPYYGDFRIAEKFLQAAHRSLRPGGRLVLVTKQPGWYQENLGRWFTECEVFDSRRYFIASGIRQA